jgi:hypothetical protein
MPLQLVKRCPHLAGAAFQTLKQEDSRAGKDKDGY